MVEVDIDDLIIGFGFEKENVKSLETERTFFSVLRKPFQWVNLQDFFNLDSVVEHQELSMLGSIKFYWIIIDAIFHDIWMKFKC